MCAGWWQAFEAYDALAVSAGLACGFDGVDLDLEGNDDRTSPFNTFGADELRLLEHNKPPADDEVEEAAE